MGYLFLALIGACSTAYQPRATERVAVVVHRGALTYVGGGHEVPVGPLGGGLRGLVAATPDAAIHARAAERELTLGVPLYLGGVTALLTGLFLSGPVGWVIIGIGAASGATGVSFMGKGTTDIFDAINLHNDSVSAPH